MFPVGLWRSFVFFKCDCLHSEPESSTGWREAQGMPGIFLSPGVAGGKICAREGWWDDLLRQSKQDGFCSLKFDLTFDSTGLQRRKRLGV